MSAKKTAARKNPAAKPAAKQASAKTAKPAAQKTRAASVAKKAATAKPAAAKRATAKAAAPAAAAAAKPKPKISTAPAAKPAAKAKTGKKKAFDPDRRRELIAAAAARRRKSVTAKSAPAPISIIKPREQSPVERHRFSVGEDVRVVSTSGMWFKHGIEFKVTAALPPQGGKLQYRIKNDQEPFERVVSESQLAAGSHQA